jgi:hypothetical protein
MSDVVLYDWPTFGLALAAVLLGWLFLAPRPAGSGPRWTDPVWVLRLLWPMYLLHQFEEHGIDALGEHYAFLGSLCRNLGFPVLATCPADAAFVFSVNVVGCWSVFTLPFMVGRSRPLLAACAWGVPLINAVAHIAPAVITGRYNPGLVTAVVLFVPLGAWMVRTLTRSGAVPPRQVPRIFVTGVVLHVVLIGSILLREHGLPYAIFLAVNAVYLVLPLLFGTIGVPAPSRASA